MAVGIQRRISLSINGNKMMSMMLLTVKLKAGFGQALATAHLCTVLMLKVLVLIKVYLGIFQK